MSFFKFTSDWSRINRSAAAVNNSCYITLLYHGIYIQIWISFYNKDVKIRMQSMCHDSKSYSPPEEGEDCI
jgi:hypothetical protein